MQRLTQISSAFFFTLLSAAIGFTGDFDGSRLLACVAEKGIEYRRMGSPKDFDPESVGLPNKFILDFKNRKIVPTQDSLIRRTTTIKQSQVIENKLILQGVDEGVEGVQDGIGWSMAISQDTGKFVISASGTSVGYVVFGDCDCKER